MEDQDKKKTTGKGKTKAKAEENKDQVQPTPVTNQNGDEKGGEIPVGTTIPAITNQEEQQPDQRIAVVIPYVSEFAQGKELKFALASMQKHLKADFKVVIIGDREDWFSDEVIHITHECCSDNPQIDVLEKLKLAIESDQVSDKFIWSNDDIYLVSPVTMADLEVLKVKGLLNSKNFGGTYKENIERTIELLSSYDYPFPMRDYATHMPVVYHKECIVELIEGMPEIQNGGYLLSSVYFNVGYGDHIPIMLNWETDNWVLPVKSPSPDAKRFGELIVKKKFLNNTPSGYSKFLEEQLEKMFPDKSIFEK